MGYHRNTYIKSTISHIVRGAALLGFSGLALVVGASQAATAISPPTAYDAIPSVLPPNVASLGYEATSTSEFGDQVSLAAGTDRTLDKVTVTMSTWALYADYANDPRYSSNTSTWTHPITVNVYSTHLDANGKPDRLLATKTETVTIPWRPVADSTCTTPTAWRAADGQCYNGLAFNATFDLSSLNVTLPDDVIVTVAYNTADYGKTPLGVAGPYNSLNVGIPSGQTPTIGTDVNADAVFWDTTYPGYTAGLKLDTGWTPNGTVALSITTKPAAENKPATMTDCKNNGWKTYGSMFKNQGECVSSLVKTSNNLKF